MINLTLMYFKWKSMLPFLPMKMFKVWLWRWFKLRNIWYFHWFTNSLSWLWYCRGLQHPTKELYQQWRLSRLNCETRSTMCCSMTWWYVTPSERYSSHLMMSILFKHSLQRDLGKGIYLLILFSTLLTGYISSLLFQTVLLLKKWRTSFISIYDYLYILCHMWFWDNFFAHALSNFWLRHCSPSLLKVENVGLYPTEIAKFKDIWRCCSKLKSLLVQVFSLMALLGWKGFVMMPLWFSLLIPLVLSTLRPRWLFCLCLWICYPSFVLHELLFVVCSYIMCL